MPPRFNQAEFEGNFRIDDGYLIKNLFQTNTVDKKKLTFLNINYLPNFSHSIKKFLTSEEKAALQDHQFQTFIIELSLNEVQLTDIGQLRTYVLSHIKSCPSFWLQNSNIQKAAQIRHQAIQEKQHRMEQWRKENPDRNVDSYTESSSGSEDVNQKVKDQEQKQQKEDKNRVVQAMTIYNQYQDNVKELKKKFLIVKNCEFPEEYLIKKFEQKENDSEEQAIFEEKVKKIRPNINFNQGYYDTTTDQYQRQYRNSYSQYQGSSASRSIDENVTEQTYYSYLKMKNIIVPDRFFKYPKIDFFIFPMVYQFILHQISNTHKDIAINDEKNFRLQNFIFQLFLSEKQTLSNQKRPRSRKSYFCEQDAESGVSMDDKEEAKQTIIKKDKTLSLIQDNEENDSDNHMNDEEENSQPNKSPSHSDSQQHQERENEKKQTKNIKQLRAKLRTEYLDAFSNFCSQKFGFLIQNYYSSSLVEASKKEKTLLFNTIKLGIDFYLFISKEENQNLQIEECHSAEKLDELPTLGEQKSNASQSKLRGKRKVTSKNKNNISLQIDTMDIIDYFSLKTNELLVYYVKNYEHFIDNYQVQLKEYITLNNQSKNKQVIGAFSSQEKIEQSVQSYHEYLNNPDTLKMRGYLYHREGREKWTEDQYKLFLELYLKHMKHPVNNRRIAVDMKNNVHQNHVKFEKQTYMIGLRKRALQNKISAQEQVKKDIENFSLSFFQKNSKLNNNSSGSPSGDDPSDNMNENEGENDEINEEEFLEEEDEEEDEEDEDEENEEDDEEENEDDDVEEADEEDGDNVDEEDGNDNDNEDEEDDDDDDDEEDEDEEDEDDDDGDDQDSNNNQSPQKKAYKIDEEIESNLSNDNNNQKQHDHSALQSKQIKKDSLKKNLKKSTGNTNGNKKKKNSGGISIPKSGEQQKQERAKIGSKDKLKQDKAVMDEEIVLSEDGSDLNTDELDAQLDELDSSRQKKQPQSNRLNSQTSQKLNELQNQKETDDLKINFSDDDEVGEGEDYDDDDFGESSYQRKKRKIGQEGQQEDAKKDDEDDDVSISF